MRQLILIALAIMTLTVLANIPAQKSIASNGPGQAKDGKNI